MVKTLDEFLDEYMNEPIFFNMKMHNSPIGWLTPTMYCQDTESIELRVLQQVDGTYDGKIGKIRQFTLCKNEFRFVYNIEHRPAWFTRQHSKDYHPYCSTEEEYFQQSLLFNYEDIPLETMISLKKLADHVFNCMTAFEEGKRE